MPTALDNLMEQASEALARMDYLTCESLCLDALRSARAEGDWAYYARILLPLQEARRQRRMIAAEGVVRLGTASLTDSPSHWLEQMTTGCIAVTRPHGRDVAQLLAQAAREQRRHVEVLWADNELNDPTWLLRPFAGGPGGEVACRVAAPPAAWRDQWLTPEAPAIGSQTPADWFIDATEALGDAALTQVDRNAPPLQRLAELERCLDVVTDHEIIHQRLGDEARALQLSR